MRALFVIFFLTASIGIFAQDCSDLFISEYVEGSGHNKAIEIYNPTAYPISLENYRLIRWDNGSVPPIPPTDVMDVFPTKVTVFPASITVAPFDVVVIGINVQTDPDPNNNTWPDLLARIDTFFTTDCSPSVVPPQPRTVCFNGDDAVELQKNTGSGWVSVDIFGCIGEQPLNSSGSFNPTAGWTALSPFFAMPETYNSTIQGPYFKQYWTQDHTMIRKPTVLKGITTNPNSGQLGPPVVPSGFNPSVEWDSIPKNTFDSLGVHTCHCSFLFSNEEEAISQIKYVLYPNPASDWVMLSSTLPMQRVDLITLTGAVVWEYVASPSTQIQIPLTGLATGIYMVQTIFDNGLKKTRKLVIK